MEWLTKYLLFIVVVPCGGDGGGAAGCGLVAPCGGDGCDGGRCGLSVESSQHITVLNDYHTCKT